MRDRAWNDLVQLRRTAEQDAAYRDSEPDLDFGVWIDALRALPAAPATEADVRAWVEGPLRRFLSFEKFLGAYGQLSGGRIQMRSMVTTGHTPEFLSTCESSFDLNERGCFAWWVSNRKPFMLHRSGAFDEQGTPIPATKREFDELDRFSLGVVAAHGVIDPFVVAGTYMSFSGVPRDQAKRTLAALKLIAPVLHMLFLQTKQARETSAVLTVLTDRQRELVDLALEGLSDKAIGLRLAISENTVGNHFRAIYAKLGISKRSQLVTSLK